MAELDHRLMSAALKLWVTSAGVDAWEPKDPNAPLAVKLIEAGFLKRCNIRCGFEVLGPIGLQWTNAGQIAMRCLIEAPNPWLPTKASYDPQHPMPAAIQPTTEVYVLCRSGSVHGPITADKVRWPHEQAGSDVLYYQPVFREPASV